MIIVKSTAQNVTWPKSLAAHLTRQGSYANPAKSGTFVTKSNLDEPLSSISMKGRYGYALATIDGFEYPVRTTDGAKTWRVAGLWFAGPWADGAAFAGSIRTISSTVAVADGNGQVLYATADAGSHWYVLFFPGKVLAVVSEIVVRQNVPTESLTTSIISYEGAGQRARYQSVDGGRHWSLL